ncbi:DUF3566 domain-containing protein [Nonomuraea jiangxiensis]|uniref:DUF3566 domain-containing protein n=1 Tax=Nonomuraea jiangxiensis TaxID=633440 RepID=A0A1G8YMJ3_9ACTN|nr:DUF3566 domain-containing protein [Nonomuraea jiangxiensis]SDK04059.1 Transmembrane protein of unknown function [Nonomuraea jiangxiensis]
MSSQGGTARTKAASGNGQQAKKPTEPEIFNAVDDGQETSPAQSRPMMPQDEPARGASPAPGPASPDGNNETSIHVRPSSLTSEAPPPAVELPRKKSNAASGSRLPRKAHLVLRRVEPWSAMKFSFVVSLVCFVVLFVAVAVLYGVLSALGVFDSIVDLVNQLGQGEQGQSSIPIDIASWFEPVRILGYTALIGAVNVVLITALATLGAVIYNIASDLVGGVEVTFSEAE